MRERLEMTWTSEPSQEAEERAVLELERVLMPPV